MESLGYEVVVCSDPIEAQGRFEAAPQRFDAALIDLTMPGTDGLTLSNHLLHARPGLPVLLMSGFAASLNVEQARAAGIREVIAKPFTRHDLASALSRVLLPVSSAEPSSGS